MSILKSSKKQKYLVYILRCADGTLYTGITTDLKRRVRQHNGELGGGAKYTKSRGPVVVAYSEKYPTRSEASKRESSIKRGLTRREKLLLIAASGKNKKVSTRKKQNQGRR